ncbi:MAG TPA: hypothetical protein VMV38_00495 [Candidatus Paceibacterota bacterium]|nr:hypothetical protein [Candidatus Paceibacterota bacterium]
MIAHSHIYLKKLDEQDGYTAWLVNGALVRKEFDENFVEYDYHGHFRFIPEKEFWIDDEMSEKEYRLYIKRLLKEVSLLKEGVSVVEAAHQADLFEETLRQNGKRMQKILTSQNQETLRRSVKKEKINEYSGVVSVWLVDGSLVRSVYMLGYAEGGHDVVYAWIPKNEIWLEESLKVEERAFIVLHELHERYLMLSQEMSYANAHHEATIVEDHYRENRKGLEERILEEIQKNDSVSSDTL